MSESISRLVRDPSIKNGQLVVKGTEILVSELESKFKSKVPVDVILNKYSELSIEDIDSVREYLRIKDETLFSCVNLSKIYGHNKAINNFTYSTKAKTLGLFGANGSGKSTLIQLLLGLHFPDYGVIEVNIDKSDMRVIPDFPVLPQQMTVDEWMETLERIYGLPLLDVDFQEEFKLDGTWVLKNLSAGQYRLAALLPMFYGVPKLIVLDEPTNFLDAFIRDRALKLMKRQITKSESKLIIASHRIDEINLFAERVLMLHKGELLADIPMTDDIQLKFEVRVNNFEAFVKHLEKRKVTFEIEDTSLGQTAILAINAPVWTCLKQYLAEDNIIYSINKIDKLQAKLKEVIR